MERAMPMIQVRDIRASMPFYERLGFMATGLWDADEPVFAIIQRGHVTLGLARSEAPPEIGRWSAAFVYVDDIDALYEEWEAAGVDMIGPPEDRDYGCRDFEVKTTDGHYLTFAQDLVSSYGPGLAEPMS